MIGAILGSVGAGLAGQFLGKSNEPSLSPQLGRTALNRNTRQGINTLKKGVPKQTLSGPHGLDVTVSNKGVNYQDPFGSDVISGILSGNRLDQNAYGKLLGQIRPGFSDMRRERINELENAAQKAVGNLGEQLSRRRVQGASFANDQLGSVRAEYERQKDQARAESFVQELEMTKQVLAQRTESRLASFNQAYDVAFKGQAIASSLLQNTQNNMVQLQRDIADLYALRGTAHMQSNLGYDQLKADIGAGTGATAGSLAGTAFGAIAGNNNNTLFGGASNASGGTHN